jgi:hypothetical protein
VSVAKVENLLNRYLEAAERLGSSFDFYKVAPALEKALKDSKLSMNAAQFFAAALDYMDSGQIVLTEDRFDQFLDILPKEWKKKVPDNLIRRLIPLNEWADYRDKSWIKQNKSTLVSASSLDVTPGEIKSTMVIKAGDMLAHVPGLKGKDIEYLSREELDEISSELDDFINQEALEKEVAALVSESLEPAEYHVGAELTRHPGFGAIGSGKDLKNLLQDAEFEFEITLTQRLNSHVVEEGLGKAEQAVTELVNRYIRV